MNNSINDNIRNKYYHLFMKELNNEKMCRELEQGIYNDVILFAKGNNIKRNWKNKIFKSIYLSRIRSIYTNINSESYLKNKNFKDKIQNNEIDIKNISKMSPYDIFPENWEELIQEKIKKDKLKYELKPEAMTDIFKCRRCGSRSCTYYEVQTRSADEPMTQFITCLNCKNNWKQ